MLSLTRALVEKGTIKVADWVLNAFRHHGERDGYATRLQRLKAEVCSTPSGITARGTIAGLVCEWLAR